MAIEIIKRGQKPSEKVYTGKCPNCNTLFRCKQSDGQHFPGDQRDGEFVTIDCPECGARAYAYPDRGGTLNPYAGGRSIGYWRDQGYQGPG